MRHDTARRLRAAGLLLIEAAGLAVLILRRAKTDPALSQALTTIARRVRAL